MTSPEGGKPTSVFIRGADAILPVEGDGGVFPIGPLQIALVGLHVDSPLEGTSDTTLSRPAGATHLQLQAFVQNVRYTLDESEATLTHGFQLIPGSVSTIPSPSSSIRLFPEATPGGKINYQWIKGAVIT